jgi:beta-phosphoglucomutase-like phosphatase (HAD superfamily)
VPSAAEVIDTWLRSAQPAVVFDFYGTLSDDEHILFDIFSELFDAHLGWAMTAEDYRDELLGRSHREIIERAVARHGRGTEDEVTELLRLRQGVYKQKVADHNPIGAPAPQLVKLLADNLSDRPSAAARSPTQMPGARCRTRSISRRLGSDSRSTD